MPEDLQGQEPEQGHDSQERSFAQHAQDVLERIQSQSDSAQEPVAVDNAPASAAADNVASGAVDPASAAQSVAQPQGMNDAQWQKMLDAQNERFEKMMERLAPKPVQEAAKPDATLARIQKLRERGEDELADDLQEIYNDRKAFREQLQLHNATLADVQQHREMQALENTLDSVQKANPTFDRDGFLAHLAHMDSRLLNSKDYTQHAKEYHTRQTAHLTANRSAVLRFYGLDPDTATPAQVQAAVAGTQSAGGASPSQGAVAGRFPVRGAGAVSAAPAAKPDTNTLDGHVAILNRIQSRAS